MIVFKIAAILILLLLLISWLIGRASRSRTRFVTQPPGDRTPREWYEAHKEGAEIMIAAAYAEQRKSGRWLGEDIVVDWHPGLDTEIDIHALHIEETGAASGVHVRRVGNGQPLVKSRRIV